MHVYRNAHNGDTVAVDDPRPDLLAEGNWAEIDPGLDAAAVAAVAALNQRRPAEQRQAAQLAALYAADQAARGVPSALAIPTVAIVGDSISNNSGALNVTTPTANQQFYARGWAPVAIALGGHRWRWVAPGATGPGSLVDPNTALHGGVVSGVGFAVGGMLAAELLAGGYVDAAVNAGANVIIVHAGTNDINAGTDGPTLAATLLKLWRRATAAGRRVVATTILPRDSTVFTGPKLTAINAANRLIRQYAATEPGVYLCDWHAAMLDANGAAPSGSGASAWYLDGLHPNSVGGWRMGTVLANTLAAIVGPGTTNRGLPINPADVLTPNPYATGTGGTPSGAPTSWTVTTVGTPSAGPTVSKVNRSDLIPGQWLQVAVTATSPNADGFTITVTDSTTSTWSAGDSVYAFAEIQADAAGWDCRSLQLDAVKSGVSTVASANATTSAERATLTTAIGPAPVGGLTLITPAIQLDPGLTAVRAVLRWYGSGTIRVGRMGVIKL